MVMITGYGEAKKAFSWMARTQSCQGMQKALIFLRNTCMIRSASSKVDGRLASGVSHVGGRGSTECAASAHGEVHGHGERAAVLAHGSIVDVELDDSTPLP
jgi:hypothetical protein